ncbi:SPL family radical SAM protein [Metabacillus sp. HB246100]
MKVEYLTKYPKSILNKGNGYLSHYTHSLNPYTGCVFACSYCYVRRMPVSLFRDGEWGKWVDIKKNAEELFRKEYKRAKAKGPVSIFMSSSTDPYQPIESKEKITRSLLEIMSEDPPDFLFVQTRSPLVTRDIDLFSTLRNIRVSVTIETDIEEMKEAFTPKAPSISSRLQALKVLTEAQIPTQAAIAPVLPSSESFGELLAEVTSRVCLDDYFMGDGSNGKRTKSLKIPSMYENLDIEEWYSPDAYKKVHENLLHSFTQGQILISKQGFAP